MKTATRIVKCEKCGMEWPEEYVRRHEAACSGELPGPSALSSLNWRRNKKGIPPVDSKGRMIPSHTINTRGAKKPLSANGIRAMDRIARQVQASLNGHSGETLHLCPCGCTMNLLRRLLQEES